MRNALHLIIPDVGQAVGIEHWRDVWEAPGIYFITFLDGGRYVPIYAGSTNSLRARAGEHYVGLVTQVHLKYQLMRVAIEAAGAAPIFNYFPTMAYYAAESLLLGSISFPCNSDHNGGFMNPDTLREEVENLDTDDSDVLDVNDLINHVQAFNINHFISEQLARNGQ